MSALLIPWCGRPVGALSIFTASVRRWSAGPDAGMPFSGQHSVHAADAASSAVGVTH